MSNHTKSPDKGQKEIFEKIVPAHHLKQINPYAAGIDIGSRSHHVAVCLPTNEISIKEFSAYTSDLYHIANWLKANKVTTIAMESTGVYWIPLYNVLEEKGFEVKLVNARHVKNVSGRKNDMADAQWLQQLHSCGLLSGAFRPAESIRPLRTYMRHRQLLIECITPHVQHMQKALFQMNVQLSNVLSDITGTTGMNIIRSIVAGARDPKVLAEMRDPRCRKSQDEIEQALTGHWRDEHLFELQQALELYDFYQKQLVECDKRVEEALRGLAGETDSLPEEASEDKKPKGHKTRQGNTLHFEASAYLKAITEVDVTKIPGIDVNLALKILGEIGADMGAWKSAGHFTSWMGLSPENKVSGGKRLSSKTRASASRAAQAFRMAAFALHRSSTALGGFLRRLKTRMGSPKAITATARKIAVIFYTMLKEGADYVEAGLEAYEQQYRDRLVKNLKKQASKLGFALTAVPVEDGDPLQGGQHA